MVWIIQFFVRHRTLTTLSITVVLSLWMMSGSREQQQRVSRALLMTVFFPLNYTLSLTSTVRNIFSENKRLRAETAAQQVKIALLEEKAAENQRLRYLVGFEDNFPYDVLPARVLMHDPSPALRSVVIGAGRRQGVTVSMPVIARNGVAGRVVQVLPTISLVQLLRDPASRTSVMEKKSRTVGILECANGRDFFFRVRTHVPIAKGDTVITSGLGGIYPGGIGVGTVEKISADANPLFNRAFVSLFVDFDRMEEAFVVRLAPQWSAFRAEVDSLRLVP